MNSDEIKVGDRVRVCIGDTSHWQKDVAKALNGMVGTVTEVKPAAILVTFDVPSPKPDHPFYGPFREFHFSPHELVKE